MSLHKRINPIHRTRINPKAWIMAAHAIRDGICYDDMLNLAKQTAANLSHDVDCARTELLNRRLDRLSGLKRKIAERLPQRSSLNAVPFYLRAHYQSIGWLGEGPQYIPDRSYVSLLTEVKPYQPIDRMRKNLHRHRYEVMRGKMDGLIRWTETIDTEKCSFIITPSFDGFSFKIDAGTIGNQYPKEKLYRSLGITVRAPREFFEQSFWGLGEHLVVRVLDGYQNSEGMSVMKTLSCDREDLYDLDNPTKLKERYYVEQNSLKATGLTESAAVKSLQYLMSKDITARLGF